MAATTWSSVSIDVQSALATAMTVSGILKQIPVLLVSLAPTQAMAILLCFQIWKA